MLQKTEIYQSSHTILVGNNYKTIQRKALLLFYDIKHHSKRRSYIRSAYFRKQKIFFDYFWKHLAQKSFKDRTRRLQFFNCGIDLIKHSRQTPSFFNDPRNPRAVLYRFTGISRDKKVFYVQIKVDSKTNQKYFMSIFPEQKNPRQVEVAAASFGMGF